jgi:hypothetical protein
MAPESGIDRLDASVNALSERTNRLQAELKQTNDELLLQSATFGRRTRLLWAALSVGVILVVLLIFTSYRSTLAQQETLRQQQEQIRVAIAESNRRWCPIVEPLAPRANDPPPVGTPEQQDRSRRIRAAFTDLVEDFGCR